MYEEDDGGDDDEAVLALRDQLTNTDGLTAETEEGYGDSYSACDAESNG